MPDNAAQPLLMPWVMVRSAGFPVCDLVAMASTGSPHAEPDAEHWLPAMADLRSRLLDLTSKDLFQQACVWQNPTVLKIGVKLQRRVSTTRPSAMIRDERVLARYLQRYHSRNESIGFFGPMSWGRIGTGATSFRCSYYSDEHEKTVIVESWAAVRLAVAWCRPVAIRRHLPVFPRYQVWLGCESAIVDGARIALTPLARDVLAALGPQTTVAELGSALSADQDAICSLLAEMHDDGLLHWGCAVPPRLHVIDDVRGQLAAVPASPERDRALGDVDHLKTLCEKARSASTAPELYTIVRDVENLIATTTGLHARRPADRIDRGRTALAMFAERPAAVQIGGELRDALTSAVGLLVDPARWMTWRAGELLEEVLVQLFADLSAALGAAEVPLGMIYGQIYDAYHFSGLLDRVQDEAWRRWQSILPPAEDGLIQVEADELRNGLAATFAAPRPSWGSGRFHSPDFMVEATSLADLVAGQFRLVLGELHLSTVTPDSEDQQELTGGRELLEEGYALARSTVRPRFIVLHPTDSPANPTGTDRFSSLNYPTPYVADPAATYLSFGSRHVELPVPAAARVLMADCMVRDASGTLVVDIPGNGAHPIVEVLGEVASHAVSSRFSIFPFHLPAPRVVVGGRLVLQRRSWVFPAQQLVEAGPTAAAEYDRWRHLRELLRAQGVARYFFWRPDRGTKPVFADSENPLLLGLLIADVLKSGAIEGSQYRLTEMLPDPGHCWFPDITGDSLTAELRVTFADV